MDKLLMKLHAKYSGWLVAIVLASDGGRNRARKLVNDVSSRHMSDQLGIPI